MTSAFRNLSVLFAVIFLTSLASAEDASVQPRAALVISSKAAASTKTPAVLADVTFTVAAAGTGTLTYVWDFGDGTPAVSGASVVHAYNVAGTYTAKVTITDSTSQSTTSTADVSVTDVLKSPKLYVTLNFAQTGKDTINLQGTLRLPPGATLGGQVAAIDVGGVVVNLTLAENGSFSDANNSIKVMVKTRANKSESVNAKFYLRLKGSFFAALADENLSNRDADREPVKIKAKIVLLGLTYSSTITQEYNAAKDIKGATR